MSAAPFWSVVTHKDSMRAAAPWKKALMFAVGETSTAICSITAGYAAMATSIPGGSIPVPGHRDLERGQYRRGRRTPRGDYAKALRVLRSRPSPAPAR
jgi:hypothetical protein